MRPAQQVMAELASSGLSPEQLALVIELSATVAAEARPVEDEQAKRRRERDREYQAARRQNRQMSADSDDGFPLEVSPHTPLPKPLPKSPPISPKKSIDAWNEMAGANGLTKITGMKGKRLRAWQSRVKENGEQAVLDAIATVPRCPHWMGANDWLGNFDSLMRPDNFQRMIEGAYLPKGANLTTLNTDQIKENRMKLAELYDRMGRNDEANELRKLAA